MLPQKLQQLCSTQAAACCCGSSNHRACRHAVHLWLVIDHQPPFAQCCMLTSCQPDACCALQSTNCSARSLRSLLRAAAAGNMDNMPAGADGAGASCKNSYRDAACCLLISMMVYKPCSCTQGCLMFCTVLHPPELCTHLRLGTICNLHNSSSLMHQAHMLHLTTRNA